MNVNRKLLKIWLTISSLVGFVAGWFFIAHTVDSNSTITIGNTTITMPEFQDIPSINGVDQNTSIGDVQTFSINTSQPFFSPQLRTGGS